MSENRRLLFFFFLIIGIGVALFVTKNRGFSPSNSPNILPNEIMDHIRYLSDDERKGRYPGTMESRDIISYIIKQFRSYGIRPGVSKKSYTQSFDLTDELELGENNFMVLNGDTLVLESDYIPLWFSGKGPVSAPVVFAGYGFNINEHNTNWDDYSNIDARGKWVLVMRNNPTRDVRHPIYGPHSTFYKKMLVAKDNGAAGIIYISQKEDSTLFPFKYIPEYGNSGIPAIHIDNVVADKLLKESGWNRERLQKKMNEKLSPFRLKLENISVSANVDIKEIKIRAANIIGELRSGHREYRDEYIVIGAHFDHLGLGGPGSGSLKPGNMAIHNGADDNASGVAGLLELAHLLKSQTSRLKRSILFIAFDAEEKGLIGSKYFVENPTIDLEKITTMINLDMIGRLDSVLYVGGVGSSIFFSHVLDTLEKETSLIINRSIGGYGRSDHVSFYNNDIPVLFFFSGSHEHYHTPDDDWRLINLKGETEILKLIHKLVYKLSRVKERPVFQNSGLKNERMTSVSLRVTLGLMPHYGSQENGLKIEAITKKSGPAAKAGIKKGDIIKSINGKSVSDIYEYMDRLRDLRPGMTIPIEIRRGEKTIIFPVDL